MNDLYRSELDRIRRNGGVIIDLGAGNGDYFRNYFAGSAYKAVDLKPAGGVDIVGDVHHLPIADNSVDAVITFSLLEHTHSPEQVALEIIRILKPGGRLLLTVPFIHPYHGGACPDYYRFTHEGLRYVFRDMTDIRIESDGGLFFALQDFIPPPLGWIRPVAGPVLRLLDRLFTRHRSSAHQWVLAASKPSGA